MTEEFLPDDDDPGVEFLPVHPYPCVRIDPEVPATYVYLRDHEAIVRTVEMPTEGMGITLNVDINAEGKAIGVEILS